MNPAEGDPPPDASTARTPGAVRLTALTVMLVLGAGCGGCGGDATSDPSAASGPARPAASDPLVAVDGVTVTFGDIADAVAYLDSIGPEFSERTKMRRVLEEFALPMAFARRDFAARRAELLALARTIRSSSGNATELEAATAGLDRQRQWFTRRDLPIPVSSFLFDPAHVGAVSEPIEVPQGWILSAAFDLAPARLVFEDRCDAMQVAFSHFDANTWATWFRDLQLQLKGKTTYVHPDYRDAMPLWLDLP